MKLTDLAHEPASGYEGTIRRWVRIEDRDSGLKGLFEHIRNYAICGGILAVAAHLGKTGEPLSVVTSVLLILLFFALLALNMLQGLVMASALGISRWAGIAFGLFMVLVLGQLAVVVGLAIP